MRQAAAPRRVQQRTLDTRDRLLEAALPIFAARGFDGATTRAIARRAGVALAALPYHFETKDALWRAAVDRIFARLAERMTAQLPALDALAPRARMQRFLREFVHFAAEHPELHRFMLQEGTAPSARLTWLIERHVRPLFADLSARIADAQRSGLVAAGRPEHLYYAMIGAASMPYAMAPEFALLTGADPRAPGWVDAHVECLLALFFPAPPARNLP